MSQVRSNVPVEQAPMGTDRAGGHEFVRGHGPVFQDVAGRYYVTTAAGVQYVLQHPKIFSSQKAFVGSFGTSFDLVPLAVDPPDHVRYRRILDPLFSPRQITPMEDELRQQARDLILSFSERGSCDAISELAALYPTQVFLEVFGLPLEDRDRLTGWVRTINENLENGMAASPALAAAGEQLTAYLKDAVAKKRANLGEDLLSLILQKNGEDAWDEDEILGFGWLFCLAGLDTVTATMGFVLHYLARHPEIQRRLRDDPASIMPTLEEIMRLETVVWSVPRVTNEDVELEGTAIPAGSVVLVMLGSANRDPERFPNGEELDAEQAGIGHFTFGGGIHRCVGSHLARRELRIVVEEMLALVPEFHLAEGFDSTIAWPTSVLHFETLPLVWAPR